MVTQHCECYRIVHLKVVNLILDELHLNKFF